MQKASSAIINYKKCTYIIVYSTDNIQQKVPASKTDIEDIIQSLQLAIQDKCTIVVCPWDSIEAYIADNYETIINDLSNSLNKT